MSVRHAVLGMLLDGPGHSYQLADRLKKRLGPEWEINSGHLSQTIRSLEGDGLVAFAGVHERHRRRRLYELTEEGMIEIESWWYDREIPDHLAFRQTLMLKLALVGPDKLDDALLMCHVYERECLTRINRVSKRKEEVEVVEGPLTLADDVVLSLSLSSETYLLECNMKLAQHAQRKIRWMLNEQAVWPGTRMAIGARVGTIDRSARGQRR